ncbi:T9SS type A sorting domain-containing protein [Mangrovimonas aestuarii]|uniref:T9SS type A sorting domain-containing protein n=1 Tax=Mangrovimonas aestuarii TaxID=3018443 RepID=UPI002379271E|nr:T9SS type A sorting domain-containing protein [Mangrovimonas aestuarii]
MKTKFLSKLNNRLLLVLVCFTIGLTNTYGQIVYTDIEPDFVSENLGDIYYLDLNNDNITDFTISSTDWDISFDWLQIDSANFINAFIGVSPWYINTRPLNSGDLICSIDIYNGYADWYSPALDSGVYGFAMVCPTFEEWCDYSWQNTNNKFLGLRFKIGNETHYGWARLDITNETNWTIKDYAYNSIPGDCILAGQSTLSIEDNTLAYKLKIATSNNLITIHNLKTLSNYSLYTITGNKVLEGVVSEQNNQISTNRLSKGIYIIELSNPNTGYSIKKKLIL